MSPGARRWADRIRLPRRRRRGVERADGARIARSAVLDAAPGGRIVLGPHAVIGPRCRLGAAPGAVIRVDGVVGTGCRLIAAQEIVVAPRALLGDHCALIDVDPVADDAERPLREQGLRAARIRIEEGARLGPGVAVLAGCTVGANATVLANSVVTRDVAPGAHAAGAPARVVAGGS